MSRLYSPRQQVLAIRHKPRRCVRDAVLRQLPCLSRTDWNHAERTALCWLRHDPSVIRRNSQALAVTDTYRRRTVGVPNEGGIVRPPPSASSVKSTFLPSLLMLMSVDHPSQPSSCSSFDPG